jgi:Na+/H+ antiporter NhaD/arsenite permease-like protein
MGACAWDRCSITRSKTVCVCYSLLVTAMVFLTKHSHAFVVQPGVSFGSTRSFSPVTVYSKSKTLTPWKTTRPHRQSRVVLRAMSTNETETSNVVPMEKATAATTQLNGAEATSALAASIEGSAGAHHHANPLIPPSAAALISVVTLAFLSQSPWMHDHADVVMIGLFVLGYLGIIFEEVLEFNKAGVALLMSTGLWITYADYYQTSATKATESVLSQLSEQLAEVSDICFFLLAASTIVEVVDAHQGFKVVTDKITTTSQRQLFWTIGFLTFFLSSILNNLTVTIVMVSLLRKLVPNYDDRRLFGAMVVVAANAGGVWTPIGDVTTTMLWINHQLSTVHTITDLAIPSIVCLVASLAVLVQQVPNENLRSANIDIETTTAAGQMEQTAPRGGNVVFGAGIASLLAVPVFNELTGLPPYLAMLTGLGVMWVLTDALHMDRNPKDVEHLKVPAALSRLDTSGILFFLGILMSIGVLDKSGLLKALAVFLSDNLPSLDIIATAIGLFSALIDNVPLVAATMYVGEKVGG